MRTLSGRRDRLDREFRDNAIQLFPPEGSASWLSDRDKAGFDGVLGISEPNVPASIRTGHRSKSIGLRARNA